MKVRIAVVQFKIAHQNPPKNQKRIERFIAKAARKKADAVVLPEDCIMGSIFGDLLKIDTTGAARAFFVEMAKKYHIDIVTGTRMERSPEGDLSMSYYINARGEILGSYAKNHLYPSERAFLKPGTEAPVFQTAFGKAAIVICWDMLFPEIFERIKKQGAEIIYCPSYWSREIPHAMPVRDKLSEERLLDALCITRAMETNTVLVYANAAGVQKYKDGSIDTLIGHSQVVMPALGAIKRLNHHREAMFIQEVDTDLLAHSAKIYHA